MEMNLIRANVLDRLISERPHLQQDVTQIATCSDPDRRQQIFDGCIGQAEDAWIKMALCHSAALQAGEPLDMPDTLKGYLDDICRGFLLPALIASPSISDELLAIGKKLPLVDQKHLATNQPIKLLLADGDNRMLEPAAMTGAQIRQAIGPKGIRSLDEQRLYLAEKRQAQQLAPPETPYVIQRRPRRGITVRKDTFLTPDMLRQALRELGENAA